MPVTVSHTEFATIGLDHGVILVGGCILKEPPDYRTVVTDVLQVYDTQKNVWSILGHLPYGVKAVVSAYWDGYLFVFGGQRDGGENDPCADRLERRCWKAAFNLRK